MSTRKNINDWPYEIDMNGVYRNGKKIKTIQKGSRQVIHLYNKGRHKKFYLDELLEEYFPQWEPPEQLKILLDSALKEGKMTREEIKELYDIEM